MLHTSGCHWLTVSTIGCEPGHVNVYDSMLSFNVPRRTKEQIAAILFFSHEHISLHFQAVQVQRGSTDCGIFAIAFVTSLCYGEDPVQTNYVQHELRSHLLNCLERRHLTTFLRQSQKRSSVKARSEVKIELHCSFRLPESGKMLQCNSCSKWHHFDCIWIPKDLKNLPWLCRTCSSQVLSMVISIIVHLLGYSYYYSCL